MYFITTIGPDDTRCVGYLKDLNRAIEAVKENACDINEAGCYPYVVIEDIEEGLYQYDQNPLWFKFNEETEEYEKSDRPDFVEKYLVGFGIG